MSQLIPELLALATELAVAAGDGAAAGRSTDTASGRIETDTGLLATHTKTSPTDVVTRHDKAAEQLIVDGIVARRPHDAIVGEEGTDRAGSSGIAWHIDPIDGTTNFLYGLPMWSTSIAAVDADGSAVGVVYVPVTGELFAAARNGGATRNGQPIRASPAADVALALVATGFGYRRAQREQQGVRLARVIGHVRDVRRSGSAAIDLAYTAAGFHDGYYEENLNSWDMAAGELIAREAGCISGDFAGGPPRPDQLLVAAPGVFAQLQTLLRATLLA